MADGTDQELWAVVLAAGEGTRLGVLTAALYGRHVPKQFAILEGSRSLLQATLDRIAPLVPASRTLVVVGSPHRRLAEAQLRPHPGVDLVVQPSNLDTGPGILLPLARLRARAPDARVAILPSDHHIPNPAPMLHALRRASAGTPAGSVTLLGIVPDAPEPEYGWIVPAIGHQGGGLRRVQRFVEKPPADLAAALMKQGGLWNSFVLRGRLADLWGLATKHLPWHAAGFETYTRAVGTAGESAVLESLYRSLVPANFSRAVLERGADLRVLPVAGSGWSDWGSPLRVLRSLQGTAALRDLRRRMAQAGALAAA